MIYTIDQEKTFLDGSQWLPINRNESAEICEIGNAFIDFLYEKEIALNDESFESILLTIERYLLFKNDHSLSELEDEFYSWYTEQNLFSNCSFSLLTIISCIVAEMFTMIYEGGVKTFWWEVDFGKTLSINYFGKIIDLEEIVLDYFCERTHLRPLIPNLDFYRIEGNSKQRVRVDFTAHLEHIMQLEYFMQ